MNQALASTKPRKSKQISDRNRGCAVRDRSWHCCRGTTEIEVAVRRNSALGKKATGSEKSLSRSQAKSRKGDAGVRSSAPGKEAHPLGRTRNAKSWGLAACAIILDLAQEDVTVVSTNFLRKMTVSRANIAFNKKPSAWRWGQSSCASTFSEFGIPHTTSRKIEVVIFLESLIQY